LVRRRRDVKSKVEKTDNTITEKRRKMEDNIIKISAVKWSEVQWREEKRKEEKRREEEEKILQKNIKNEKRTGEK